MTRALTQRLLALAPTIMIATCATNPVNGEANFGLLCEEQEVAIGPQEVPKVTDEHSQE